MKTCFASLLRLSAAVVMGLFLLLSVVGFTFAQSSAPDAVPVLEGLDPVMLVQGKEVQGDIKITVTRGNFQYLFANEANKATFEKDPARYEIQLNGACARMGPPVTGNPDLFTVYQGHIYILGSGDCKTRFEAAPTRFLEAEGNAKSKIILTPETLKKGNALIEKAVSAMGSASLLDGLTSFQEKSTALQTRQSTDVEVKTDLRIVFPDRIRIDQVMPDYGNPSVVRQVGLVITPGEAFAITPNGTRPMPEAARIDLEHEMQRRPLSILRARSSDSLNAVATGAARVGETDVEQVVVNIEGTSYTVGIDPTNGRLLSLSYRHRGPRGEFGAVTKVFSDFRTVEGVTLPFKVTAIFNDQPWKEQSATVESITINAKADASLFERPKTARTQ
jgi:YHS domain-containing protein